MSPSQDPTLYFAYGSNLSTTQMAARCPSSAFHSLAFFPDWKWIISQRGYANVIPHVPRSSASEDAGTDTGTATETATGREGEGEGEGVWGLVYTLTPADEAQLDLYEGVPHAYTKEYHTVQIRTSVPGTEAQTRSVLVYVDRLRKVEGKPRQEYVSRMERGIREAGEKGLDRTWAVGAMGRFLGTELGVEGDKVERELREPREVS